MYYFADNRNKFLHNNLNMHLNYLLPITNHLGDVFLKIEDHSAKEDLTKELII